jgi:hypothetical protein
VCVQVSGSGLEAAAGLGAGLMPAKAWPDLPNLFGSGSSMFASAMLPTCAASRRLPCRDPAPAPCHLLRCPDVQGAAGRSQPGHRPGLAPQAERQVSRAPRGGAASKAPRHACWHGLSMQQACVLHARLMRHGMRLEGDAFA